MKKLFTFLIALVFISGAIAQSPVKMSYQAVVRNAGGILVQSSDVGIKISIIQGSVDGTAVYSETHSKTTNANGLVTLEIGTGETSNEFSTINWSTGPYFIKTEIDPSGGTNYTISGMSELMSVPYALVANESKHAISADSSVKAQTATNMQLNDLTDVNTNPLPNEVLKFNGAEWIASDNVWFTGTGLQSPNGKTIFTDDYVGIGTDNPQASLHIHAGELQMTSADSTYGLRIGFGGDFPAYPVFVSDRSFAFRANNGGRFNFITSGGLVRMIIKDRDETFIDGFTSLGNYGVYIANKKLTGTTASTQGGTATFAHGLDASKIIGVTVLVRGATQSYIPPSYTGSSSFEYDYFFDGANFYIINKPGNSAAILSKPYTVLITFEE